MNAEGVETCARCGHDAQRARMHCTCKECVMFIAIDPAPDSAERLFLSDELERILGSEGAILRLGVPDTGRN